MDGVFIGARARILGCNVMLGSGAAIAGLAQVEDHCFIGTNATVLPKVVIGAGTLLGAGSAATRDLPKSVIAIGVPAEPRRKVREGDEVPSPDRIAGLPKLN